MISGGTSSAAERKPEKSLHSKAILFVCALAALGALLIAIALYLKNDLKQHFELLVDLQRQEHILQLAVVTTSDLLRDLSNPHRGGGREDPILAEWQAHLLALAALEDKLRGRVLPGEAWLDVALRELESYRAASPPPKHIDSLAARLQTGLGNRVSDMRKAVEAMERVQAEREARYQTKADAYALAVFSVGLAGLVAAGVFIGGFFTRLTNDLQKLGARVSEIMIGRYARPSPLARNDEVGRLAAGIDVMAETLERQVKEMELFRTRFQQQEKMFMVGTFATGIAHEIGNPLQTILAICEHVRGKAHDGGENAAEIVSRLDIVADEAGRLAATIREISDFARPSPAEMQPTDLNQVVRTTIHLLRFDPRFRNITLTADLSQDVSMIRATGDHLIQVLMNVLINAADAIAHNAGKIAVSTRQENGLASITVVDNGSGMPKEVLARATEAFFTTKPRGKGTGLGLAVCKTIVDEHGGILSIESVPHQVTTVSIRLPINHGGDAHEASGG
jgi:signal transduction histidine kinase